MFKSYYVVWKLNIITHKIPWEIQFKSYYVVWKLAAAAWAAATRISV